MMTADQLALSWAGAPKGPRKSFKISGLFAGIGGIEAGLHRAGHETLLLCERDPLALAVLRARFHELDVEAFSDDVRSLTCLPSDTDLLAAGFPCQDLSQAGRTEGITGEESGLVEHVFRLLRDQDIPWLLLENVPFMLRLDRGDAMRYLTQELENLEYRWAYRVIDTRAFGIPQRRRRVFLIATKQEDPAPALFGEDAGAQPDPEPDGHGCGFYWTEGTRGLGRAVAAIPTLKGGSGLGIPSPPAIWMPPDATITDYEIVTPEIRDAERLQGFDPGWTDLGGEDSRAERLRWKLVGNAVTVDVAEWVGRVLSGETHRRPPAAYAGPALSEGDRWPDAAFGSRDGRFLANASAWPMARQMTPIEEFLNYEPQPLSVRATEGFLSRLRKSSLKGFPREKFFTVLEAHIETMTSKMVGV